jgi:hypothetical protein
VKKKKLLFTATFISILLFSWIAGTRLLEAGKANPHFYTQEEEEVSPPPDAKPPRIIILSPENDTKYVDNSVFLAFRLQIVFPTVPELFYYYLNLYKLYYEASWLPNKTYIETEMIGTNRPQDRFSSEENYAQWHTYLAFKGYVLNLRFNITLEGVPDGSHTLEVSAVLRGSRPTSANYDHGVAVVSYGMYTLIGSSSVNFVVDNTAPEVSIVALENKTYNTPDVLLDWAVNEAISQVAYSLDGLDNITISGNTTLAGLSTGEHYVRLYATDLAGHIGVSETVFFTVEEPSPTAVVTAASIASVSAIAVGLLVYLKKRKK